jgi:hypothetical protein
MNPTLTPSLPMEQQTPEEYISSIVNPIFNEVLQEASKNRMSVGGVGISYCIYHPHNYRLYLDFEKKNLKSETDLKWVGGSVRNKTEWEFKNFLNCTITIKQTQIEIRNYVEADKKFLIDISTNEPDQFKHIIETKDSQCLTVLKEFIKAVGGSSRYHILNRWCENKIWQEKSINQIDKSFKWDNSISKKLYEEKNVEFKTPIAAATYISNRAVEEVAPRIKTDLEEIRELGKVGLQLNVDTCKVINALVSQSAPAFKEFHSDIRIHNAALKGINSGMKKFNQLLSNKIYQKKLTDL